VDAAWLIGYPVINYPEFAEETLNKFDFNVIRQKFPSDTGDLQVARDPRPVHPQQPGMSVGHTARSAFSPDATDKMPSKCNFPEVRH